MDNDNLTIAVALQYKAILSLYDSADKQENEAKDIKVSIQDIRRNQDDFVGDTLINKMSIDSIINLVDKLTTTTDKLTTLTENISERVTLLKEEIIDKVNNHNRLFYIFAEAIDKINNERRREKILYLCDFIILIGYTTYVYWSK
jgi:chaperonin cofactor prefoldin